MCSGYSLEQLSKKKLETQFKEKITRKRKNKRKKINKIRISNTKKKIKKKRNIKNRNTLAAAGLL